MSFEDFAEQQQPPIQMRELGESEYKELLYKFFDRKKNIEFKTELSDEEIKEINRLYFIADLLDFKMLKDFLTKFMELRVSQKREGRKEFIYALKPDYNQIPIQQLQSPILQNQQEQQPKKRFNFFGGNR